MRQGTGKTVFLLCNLYVSAVVGAGFATGQELMGFFTCYGPVSFVGIFLSCVLFMIIGPLVLQKAVAYDAYSMGELVSFRFGKKGETLMKGVTILLEFAVLTVMLAGLRTLLCQMGMSNGLAALLSVTGLFLMSFHKTAALRINNILTPIVIAGITVTGGMLLRQKDTWTGWQGTEVDTAYPWWVSALLYAGFNLLLAMPALCLAGKTLQKEGKMTVIIGGGLGGACIGGMAMLTNCVIFAYGVDLYRKQMPVVELALEQFSWLGMVYQGIIFCAMASSAVICIRCIVDLFPHSKNGKGVFGTGLLCVLAGILCFLDFSQLIGTFYPVFGGIGILAVLFILW